MVATDAVAVGTPKEGAPVKAKVGGVVVTDAAGGGGGPATTALIWSYFFHRGFVSVI